MSLFETPGSLCSHSVSPSQLESPSPLSLSSTQRFADAISFCEAFSERTFPSSLERRIPSVLLPLWQYLSFFSPQISSISCYFYVVTRRFALISSGIMFCWVDVRTFRVLFLFVRCSFSSRLLFRWRSYIQEGTLWARIKPFCASHFCIACEIQRWRVLVILSICLWTIAGNILVHFVAQDFENLITFKTTGKKSSVKTFGHSGEISTFLNTLHGFYSICSLYERCAGMSTYLIWSNFLAGMIGQKRCNALRIFWRTTEGHIQRLLSLWCMRRYQ